MNQTYHELITKSLRGTLHVDMLKEVLGRERNIICNSISKAENYIGMLVEEGKGLSLFIFTQQPEDLKDLSGESEKWQFSGDSLYSIKCSLDHGNAVCLRKVFPWTAPGVINSDRSFGTGDRIGGSTPATPAHIEVCERFRITPMLAQQSVRENHKTGRDFKQVLDDVTWSVFRCGYRSPWGADADHLKTWDDIEEAVRAGFTMFTIDPSDMIDNGADTDSPDILSIKLSSMFSPPHDSEKFLSKYEMIAHGNSEALVRCVVKYLPAVRFAVKAYRHLVDLLGEKNFNFELSVDETSTVTSELDHRLIISELIQEGVHLYSLAPRFEGTFEKGIDYKGSIKGFTKSLETHAAIAREYGEYRLSLHSGSDKFSIYKIYGEVTDGYFHVKTAGTSYLEAIKTIAMTDFDLFYTIFTLSIETFNDNVKSYSISTDIVQVPPVSQVTKNNVIDLINHNPHVRQVLHIAYGIVLSSLNKEIRTVLIKNRGIYHDCLVMHLGNHLELLVP